MSEALWWSGIRGACNYYYQIHLPRKKFSQVVQKFVKVLRSPESIEGEALRWKAAESMVADLISLLKHKDNPCNREEELHLKQTIGRFQA